MSRPFENLEERLLKAGIAPRHVRRYIRELEDHFADLIATQNERGYGEPDASLRARALLGEDDELFEAMARCREFRSLPARAPWLVFGLMPPVLIVAGLLIAGLTMAAVAAPLHGPQMPLPAWCAPVAKALSDFANYAAGPLTALFLLATAWRQRLSGAWPVLGVIMAVVFGVVTTLDVVMPHGTSNGAVSVQMGIAFPAVLRSIRFVVAAILTAASVWLWKRRRGFA